MEDLEERLDLMQEQIDVLTDLVKSQVKAMNTIIETLKTMEEFITLTKDLPDNITWVDPSGMKQ